jgi:hypothetical protein
MVCVKKNRNADTMVFMVGAGEAGSFNHPSETV